MRIEIWFDFICPYCYLGERKLELALEKFEHRDEVTLIFKSFELNMASNATKGKDINQIISDKYGVSYAQAKANNDGIAEAARQVGLDFHFDLLKVGSTRLAHEIAHYAASNGKDQELIRRFFRGVFSEGIDIEDEDLLLKLSKELGLDLTEFKAQREKGVFSAKIQGDEDEAGKLGINSIPHFIIDGKYTVSGAQSPEYFLDALQKAYRN
jgi:predicted DsbA family dithiol-disulfide isomerase